MNDRELLEMAAKAAGVRHIEYHNDYQGEFGLMQCTEYGKHTTCWSPLTDDGDALRLAVKLNMSITIEPDEVWAGKFDQEFQGSEASDNAPYAATRRAIVRAAASIGETL